MANKLVNLIAIATLAILASFGPSEVTALSLESHHFVRHNSPHHALARRAETKTNRRRCKARPVSSSLIASSSTKVAVPTSKAANPPKVSSSAPVVAPPPKQTSSSAPAPPPQQQTTKAAPKTTKAPAPEVTSSPPPASGERKVGIAWNGRNAAHLANFLKNPRVGFCYSWSPYKCAGVDNFPHVQSLPMIWGWKHVADAKKMITSTAYAKYILGPNEPDHQDQANMSPGEAVSFWRQVMEPYGSRGHRLAAPAPTNGNRGIEWMRSFMNQCTGCKIDYTVVHWYGTNKQQFMDHVMFYRNTWGRRVFVTEFACQNFGGGAQCSRDQIFDFMRTVTDWMDGYDGVIAYFAFGVLDNMGNVNPGNRLLDTGSGQPTELGRVYLN